MRRFRGTSMKAWRCDFDKHGVGAALSAFHSPKWQATQKSQKKKAHPEKMKDVQEWNFHVWLQFIFFITGFLWNFVIFVKDLDRLQQIVTPFTMRLGQSSWICQRLSFLWVSTSDFFPGRNPVSWYDVKWYSKTLKCIVQRSHKSWPIDFIRHNLVSLLERNWCPFF